MRVPATWTSPASGRSMPPIRLSKVVLPEPDGPITATKSPAAIENSRSSKIVIVSLPLVKRLPRWMSRTSGMSDITRSPGFLVGGGLGRCAGVGVVEEGDLDGHVGKDSRVLLPQRYPHLDGSLVAVGGRDDGDDCRRNRPVRVGVKHCGHRTAGMHTPDERLIDLDLDLDGIHVDNG